MSFVRVRGSTVVIIIIIQFIEEITISYSDYENDFLYIATQLHINCSSIKAMTIYSYAISYRIGDWHHV